MMEKEDEKEKYGEKKRGSGSASSNAAGTAGGLGLHPSELGGARVCLV